MNLKDYLVYNSEELFNKYIYINSQIYNIEQKTITNIVHDFIGSDLFNQRNTIVYLLLNNDRSEFMYIAYLLYDILSTDNNNNTDSYDQKLLYDSLSPIATLEPNSAILLLIFTNPSMIFFSQSLRDNMPSKDKTFCTLYIL